MAVQTSVRVPRGQKRSCAHQAAPLRTWTEFLREPPRATLAIAEAPVVYAVHIIAPLPLLYAINQVQPMGGR